MGAFDRLQNYSAKHGVHETSDVFDTTTPEGAFLSRIHKEGYSMYSKIYTLGESYRLSDVAYAELSLEDMQKYDDSIVLNEAQYEKLSDVEKAKYEYEVKYSELYTVLTTEGNQIINAVAGSGKALKNGTSVHTEKGFAPIEKLKVGDLVYSDDGKLYPVVGVYPQPEPKREYHCIFENGVKISCCEDHLWTDFDGITRNTKEMYDNKPRSGFVLPRVLPRYIENCKTNKYLCMSIDERQELIEDLEEGRPDSLTPLSFNFFEDYTDAIELYKSMGYAIIDYHRGNGKYEFIPKLHHRILEIVETEYFADMTCIEIDSPTHLYLTVADIPTHNTTGLVLKILHDIVTGEAMTLKGVPGGHQVRVVNKMWVCTFLKTGATELETALINWQRKLGYSQTANQITFSTMDAEFKRCLNAMGVETPIGDAGKIHGLLVKAINSCGITRDGGYNLTNEDYQIIAGIVTYYRGRLDQKRYQHPSCKDYGLTPSILDLVVKQFENLRHVEGVMDFEEMMELLYRYLYITPNPAVQDFVANRYNYIYADEFQDTSQMAYAILKFYARGHLAMNNGGLRPQGDGSQTIDTGTELVEDAQGGLSMQKTSVTTQPTMTDGLYTGFKTLGKFTVVGDVSQTIYSFRGSDSKILFEEVPRDFNPTNNRLSCNWRCPANILNPVVPSIHVNPDSATQDIIASRQGGEFYAYKFTSYRSMVSQLKKDILKDMDEDLSVAILCRTNFDGMIPAFVLESEGKFDFSISGENMTLNSPLPRKIIGVSALFTERSTPAVKNALSFFVGRRGEWQLKQLMDILKTNNKNIWQIPMSDIRYSCPMLEEFVQEIRDIIMPDGVNRDKTKELEALRAIYCLMITDVFDGDSAYCESARAYLETLLYIIDNNDFKTIYEFLEEIEFLNDKLAGRIKKTKAPIQIATVHEFKGKERDSVYIWNDSEGTFPSSKCDDGDADQLAEERRVHYIACTRAKKREHIYTLATKIGRFVKEMDLILENPIGVGVKLQK